MAECGLEIPGRIQGSGFCQPMFDYPWQSAWFLRI